MTHRHYYQLQSNKTLYLRSAGYVSPVTVFENDNGKPGKFLRTEPATRYDGFLRKAVQVEH